MEGKPREILPNGIVSVGSECEEIMRIRKINPQMVLFGVNKFDIANSQHKWTRWPVYIAF